MEIPGLKTNKLLESRKGNPRGFMISARLWFLMLCQAEGEKSWTLERWKLPTEILE